MNIIPPCIPDFFCGFEIIHKLHCRKLDIRGGVEYI